MQKKYNDGLRSGAVAPPMFFLTLLIMIILSFFVDQLWTLPFLMGGIYFLAITIAAGLVAFEKGLKYFPLLLPIYFVIHAGMAYGVIRGLLSKNESEYQKDSGLAKKNVNRNRSV